MLERTKVMFKKKCSERSSAPVLLRLASAWLKKRDANNAYLKTAPIRPLRSFLAIPLAFWLAFAWPSAPLAKPLSEQIISTSRLPKTLSVPFPTDRLGVTIHRLSNGMTVYISTNREQPMIATAIVVRAGARHDPPDSTGLAHYLEHMLFKGTSRLGTQDYDKERPYLVKIAQLYRDLRKAKSKEEQDKVRSQIDAATVASSAFVVPNELASLYAKLGVVYLNAFTDYDGTAYISTPPSRRFRAWVAVEAERFHDPAFRLFYPELETVYEEKNGSLDSTNSRMWQALRRGIYSGHPYGTQSVTGHPEHLKIPSFDDMTAFFRRWYVPNNMAIILSGDTDAKTALPLLEQFFGKLKPRMLPAPSKARPIALKQRTTATVLAEGKNEVVLAWKTVPAAHKDRPALEVMNMIVSNRISGILERDLVLTQLVPEASSLSESLSESGFWSLEATAGKGQSHEKVEKLLLGVVQKLKQGRFLQEDIDAVVLDAEKKEMAAAESNRARVEAILRSYYLHVPWEQAHQKTALLSKVTRADVIRVAKSYLNKAHLALYRVRGKHEPLKIPKPKVTALKIDPARQSAFAKEILAMPDSPIKPEWVVKDKHYKLLKTEAGPLVAVKNLHNSLFTATYRFEIGMRREPLLCFALGLLKQSGAGKKSAAQMRRRLWITGTEIDFDCTADQLRISVSGIRRNLRQGIALLKSWLRHPRLKQRVLAKYARNEITKRRNQIKEPRFLFNALISYVAHGKQSGFLISPSNKDLEKATATQLAALIKKIPRYSHRTSYFGTREAGEAAKILSFGKNKYLPLAQRDPIVLRKPTDNEILFLKKKMKQSYIAFFRPRAPLSLTDRPMISLVQRYVGGMDGLLFQEIREARGLAYTVRAYFMDNNRPKDESSLLGFLATQGDKAVEATNMMLALLKKTPIQSPRFSSAQQALEEVYKTTRVIGRNTSSLVEAWHDLGLEEDPRPGFLKAIRSAKIADFTSFAKQLSSGPMAIGIIGDESSVDLKKLKEIGRIDQLTTKDLFSY